MKIGYYTEAKNRVCAKINHASCLCQLLVHCSCGLTAASATAETPGPEIETPVPGTEVAETPGPEIET